MQVQFAQAKKRRQPTAIREIPKFFVPSSVAIEYGTQVQITEEFTARWWPGNMQEMMPAPKN